MKPRPRIGMFVLKYFAITAIGLFIICISVILVFYKRNVINVKDMDSILIQDQEYTIYIDQYSCKYNFETMLWKDEPMDGKLFMRDGRTFDIKYNAVWNCFSIDGKFGYYSMRSNLEIDC